ncbi:hypothetical protein ABEB36_005005 [Hypothenemus hampei]|uniref:Uncharacterized protein n=1 Tax=Hypothenemus hampei TaxID=57062 RepID=A0ABD1EWL2_HYPHA
MRYWPSGRRARIHVATSISGNIALTRTEGHRNRSGAPGELKICLGNICGLTVAETKTVKRTFSTYELSRY